MLVSVKAAGLNRADLLQRRGHYPPPAGYSPNIPGLEFAGQIVETGENVAEWKACDRVFGITAGEAQAELLLIESGLLARIPDNLSFTEAAAIPEAFITAHDAVFTQGELKGGETAACSRRRVGCRSCGRAAQLRQKARWWSERLVLAIR